MTKKEQYLIIVYGIAFAILAAITISVWFDTDKAIEEKKKKEEAYKQGFDISSHFTV